MKDTQLYLVIGILVSIDLIAMTAWQIFDPFYRETKELAPYVSTQNYRNMLSQPLPLIWKLMTQLEQYYYYFQELDYNGGVKIIPRIESCRSTYMTVFVGCIYAYKGLLMVTKNNSNPLAK